MTDVSQSAAPANRRRHRFRAAALATALLCGAAGPAARAQDRNSVPFFPVEDVRPGMRGIGRTVFQGNRIEDFKVEILGILQSAGPKQSVILARLSGGPLAEAGVIQGMSGSPVYLQGKLLGAVAFGFPYSKEPIAGIQPIGQMLSDSTFNKPATFPGASRIALDKPFRLPDLPLAQTTTANLKQILTPLSLGGFTPRTLEAFAPELRKLGFEPQQAVSSGSPNSQPLPARSQNIAPGSMISVQLVSGDMSMGADGTVTYVDGNHLYAFGHRFLDLGGIEMPFATSDVIAVVPNLNSSFKLSNPRHWAGTILSDRSTAVAGEIGRSAHTVPATITVRSADTGVHQYHIQLVRDHLLTPFLAQTALFSAIDATERTLGSGTMRLHTHITFDGSLAPLDLKDIFVSDSGLATQVSGDAVVTLAFLLSAGFQDLHVKEISYEVEPIQGKRQLYVSQAWTSAHSVRPGQRVTVYALLAGENGIQRTVQFGYTVPLGAPNGLLNFTVSDANIENFPDFAGMNAASAPTARALIQMLNEYRGADAAYLRVWRPEPAFTISGPQPGGELTDPPPDVALVLQDPSESPTANTTQVNTRGSSIADLRSPVNDFVVTGARTVQVEVKE